MTDPSQLGRLTPHFDDTNSQAEAYERAASRVALLAFGSAVTAALAVWGLAGLGAWYLIGGC